MTPFSFEWQWNIEYMIFFGLLYTALTIIGGGLVYCLIKSWLIFPLDEDHKSDLSEISYRTLYSKY